MKINKKIMIYGLIIVAIITASTTIGYSVAVLDKTDTIENSGDIDEEFADSNGSIVLEFDVDCCDDVSVDAWNQSQLGITEITWIDQTTVHVMAYVSTNCAEWIEGAGFYIYNDTIYLVYYVGNGGINAHCICAHGLSFTLSNLEPNEYKFELEPVFKDHPYPLWIK